MLKRLDIEGSVILKRKSAWVKRYAKVQNCTFSYKNKASDKIDKLRFDLRTAIVKLSPAGDERKQSMIYIQPDPLKPDAIRVIFDSEVIFGKWLLVIRENTKNNQELEEYRKKQQDYLRETQDINQQQIHISDQQSQFTDSKLQQPSQSSQRNQEKQQDNIQNINNDKNEVKIFKTDEKQRNQTDYIKNKQSSLILNQINHQKTVRIMDDDNIIEKKSKKNFNKSFNLESIFGQANRITQEDEIQQLVRNVIYGKFHIHDCIWYLNDSSDGVNVFTDIKFSSLLLTNFQKSVHKNDVALKSQADIIVRNLIIALLFLNSNTVSTFYNQIYQIDNFENLYKKGLVVIIELGLLLSLIFLQQQNQKYSIQKSISNYFQEYKKNQSKNESIPKSIKSFYKNIENEDFLLKLQFFVLCSPDEILKTLVDDKNRQLWDYGLVDVQPAEQLMNQVFQVTYEGGFSLQHEEIPEFNEIIEYSYFIFEQKFYIVEQIKLSNIRIQQDADQIPSSNRFDYERVWILDQVQNRPYFLRVTYLAEVKKEYQAGRGGYGAQFLIKSVSALRNYLQQSDRANELPITIRHEFQSSENLTKSQYNLITTNPKLKNGGFIRAQIYSGDFINDAIELIEDEAANKTIFINEDAGASSEDENGAISSRNLNKNKSRILNQDEYEDEQTQQNENFDLPQILWEIEQINDWKKRVGSYTEEQRQFYNQMVPKINELKGIMQSHSEWNLLVDKQPEQILIETKKSVRELTICRAQGKIQFPAIDIWRCMQYSQFRHEWDITNEKVQYIKKVGVNGYIQYQKTKNKQGFSSRDFVLQVLMNQEQNGTIIICQSTTNCTFNYPVTPDATRGETPISGFILIPDRDDNNSTNVYVINELDLKTSLPGYLIRQAYKDQGMQIERLRHVIPNWKQLFPGDKP